MVNFHYLEELSVGNKDFELEILNIYLSEIQNDLNNIQEALLNENWNEIARIAHKLKSSIQIVGLDELKTNLTRIENEIINELLRDTVLTVLGEVTNHLSESIIAVRDRLSN